MSYIFPVSQLLTLGDVRNQNDWHDYQALGLTHAHVADLIRMVTDTALHDAMSDTLEVWAPVHAWRALGVLQASEAVQPLLGLFERADNANDDWVNFDLPDAFGRLGPVAVPALAAYLHEPAHGMWARLASSSSLEKIAAVHASARADCVAVLSQQMGQFEQEDPLFNGFIAASLVETNAVEAQDVIQRAFAAGAVDESILGDWHAVAYQLGLPSTRRTMGDEIDRLVVRTHKMPAPPPSPAAKPKRKRHRKRK